MRESTRRVNPCFGAAARAAVAFAALTALHGTVQAAGGASAPPVVVATVNGEPIYESELSAGMPADSFDMTLKSATQAKLSRLVGMLMMKQFLNVHNVQVGDDRIDAQVSDLRKNPPSAGCPCCRYSSLDEYLATNFMDMSELRRSIANDVGFTMYLGSEWNKDCPTGERRDKLIEKETLRISRDYVKASQILLKTLVNNGRTSTPRDPKDAQARAQVAWQRLRKGEGFEVVAKEASEDAMTNSNGGALGCIEIGGADKWFSTAILALKPGQYSKPIESPWGFHILRREEISREDMEGIVEKEYYDRKSHEVVDMLRGSAVIKITTDKSSVREQGA